MFFLKLSRFLVGLMLGLGVCLSMASANMIAVSNVTFGAQQTTADTNGNNHYMPITFNLTWQNAWRDASSALTASPPTGNYDAAWVFIKYSLDGGTTWLHATLGPATVSGGSTPVTGGATLNDGGTGGILFANNGGSYFYGGTVNVGSNNNIPLDVIIPNEANSGYKGAFVQISSVGTSSGLYGNITSLATASPVGLVWNYGTDIGTTTTADAQAATAIVQVMAIEMVYVPTGAFYLGDGSSLYYNFQQASSNNNANVYITSSQSVAVNVSALANGGTGSDTYDDTYMLAGAGAPGNGAGITITGPSGIACVGGANCIGTSASSNTSFPTGYNAFYMMKYDLTQGQYRDFLNTLTRVQQEGRVTAVITGTSVVSGYQYVMPPTSAVAQRSGIYAPTTLPAAPAPITFYCYANAQTSNTLNGTDDGEYIAMNYVSWMDDAAYAAWAGLRPFTELEYEKAARGSNSANAGEYATGNTTLNNATGFSGVTAGTSGELLTGSTPNILTNSSTGIGGPIRAGIFATLSTTTRTSTGASYWGIMELSGNLWKRTVTVGNATGRSFVGSNGTGILDSNTGNATNCDWPGSSATCPSVGIVNGATGSGYRGGSWYYAPGNARVSDRYIAAVPNTSRNSTYGARFARTSP